MPVILSNLTAEQLAVHKRQSGEATVTWKSDFVKNMEKNKRVSNYDLLQMLAQLSQAEGIAPRDTGYLADHSWYITGNNDDMAIEYRTDYAGKVWEANKTGQPRWLEVAWFENRSWLIPTYLSELFKKHG